MDGVNISIDPNQPPVRRERRWRNLIIPILSITAVGIIALIIYLILSLTGVVENSFIDDASGDVTDIDSSPITYTQKGDEFAARTEELLGNDSLDDHMLEIDTLVAELENYLNENTKDGANDYNSAIATISLAELLYAKNQINEATDLLENTIRTTTSAQTKIYCYIALYNYFATTNHRDLKLQYLDELISFPDDTKMDYEFYPAIKGDYQAIRDQILASNEENTNE